MKSERKSEIYLKRRNFLKTAGLASVAGIFPAVISCDNSGQQQEISPGSSRANTEDWEDIRQQFQLDQDYIHMAGLLLASNPKPVREAISQHRQRLDENPVNYVQDNFSDGPARVRASASAYMGVNGNEIALTDSTSMGTALLINGLHMREDQEILSAETDYSITHDAAQFKSNRFGTGFRTIPIYREVQSATKDEIVERIMEEIRPNTRLLTGTWVQSATGLKLPVREIADRLQEINRDLSPEDRVLFFVDGVHGLGVENTNISDLNCDFFSAGTHKWMFAPRGTGILWGNPRAHGEVSPTIPTFTNGAGWGGRMSPGGFKPFEHQWAMAEAFEFHSEIGKERIQERIHGFTQQLKEELAKMDHVKLYTPMDPQLSSGMAVFDINGMSPREVVSRLKEQNILASDTPYSPSYARLTPGIYNTQGDIDNVLRAVRELG